MALSNSVYHTLCVNKGARRLFSLFSFSDACFVSLYNASMPHVFLRQCVRLVKCQLLVKCELTQVPSWDAPRPLREVDDAHIFTDSLSHLLEALGVLSCVPLKRLRSRPWRSGHHSAFSLFSVPVCLLRGGLERSPMRRPWVCLVHPAELAQRTQAWASIRNKTPSHGLVATSFGSVGKHRRPERGLRD